MKLELDKKDLALATQRLQGALTEKGTNQIALQSRGDKLACLAADRLLGIFCEVGCRTEAEGTVFVPARLFSNMVRELPAGPVRLAEDGPWLVVKAGAGRFTMKLPLLEGQSWREPDQATAQRPCLLPTARLAYMVEQVQFCIQLESPRNYGAVGYLHRVDPNTLRLVGTDGFRLASCDIAVELPEGILGQGLCLAKRGLNELQHMCQEGAEAVSLGLTADKTTLVAEIPGYRTYLRLSAVQYPNYEGVVPRDQPVRVPVNCEQLQTIAKRVLLAADKTRALQLSFSHSSLTLSAKTVGSSESWESIELDGYTGPACELAVNGKYMTDILATTTSERIYLQFRDQDEPMVLIPVEEPNGCRSQHVLVPIKESE